LLTRGRGVGRLERDGGAVYCLFVSPRACDVNFSSMEVS